jgi:hypothetical protein
MRRSHHSTDAGEQCRGLLDRLVGDPSAVDEYCAARQQRGGVNRDLSVGTPLPRTA